MQQDQRGQPAVATESLQGAWDAFHEKTYAPHVMISKVVSKDGGTRRRLGIGGQRPRAFDA